MVDPKLYRMVVDYVKKNSVTNKNLKEELKLLENKEQYLQRLALLKQANQSRISDMSRIWESPSDSNKLNDKVLNKMESLNSQCELVSTYQGTTVEMKMVLPGAIADDSDEENVMDTNEKKEDDVIVQKQSQIEGKVDKISYAIIFDTLYSSEDQDELKDEIIDFNLSESNSELEVFRHAVVNNGNMQIFTVHLHTYQHLVRERIEAMNELEDYEKMEVRRSADPVQWSTDPVQFLFEPVEDHDLNILWKVVWDDLNDRFKNEILLECTDDVAARFSQKEGAFPYLAGRKFLRNKKQVIKFVGYFVDDL